MFSQLLWRNHALGRPILGTKETVMALKRESVIEYYRQYYVPSNMVIAIAGNINNSMVRDKVSEWLHRVQNHPVSRAKLPPDIPPKNELRLISYNFV